MSLALSLKASHISSCIAKGWEVSTFQSDTMARSYLVIALDEFIKTMNVRINLLAKELSCILPKI
jgi:hypothetical protein